jgi:hypothetical protein
MKLRPSMPCKADRPVCPKCGRVLFGAAPMSMQCGTLVICQRGRGGEHCGQRVLLLPMHFGLVLPLVLTAAEYDAVRAADHGAIETLRELGALVETQREAS